MRRPDEEACERPFHARPHPATTARPPQAAQPSVMPSNLLAVSISPTLARSRHCAAAPTYRRRHDFASIMMTQAEAEAMNLSLFGVQLSATSKRCSWKNERGFSLLHSRCSAVLDASFCLELGWLPLSILSDVQSPSGPKVYPKPSIRTGHS